MVKLRAVIVACFAILGPHVRAAAEVPRIPHDLHSSTLTIGRSIYAQVFYLKHLLIQLVRFLFVND